MEYRYIGAESMVGDVRLEALGQKIVLSEEDGLMAMQGGCAIIPAIEYAKLGITSEEEKRYRFAAHRQEAPPKFREKLAAGLKRYQIIVDEAAMGIDVANVKPAAPQLPPLMPVASEEKQ